MNRLYRFVFNTLLDTFNFENYIKLGLNALHIKNYIQISPDTHLLFMDMIRNKKLNSHKGIRAVVSQDEGSREHLSQTNLSSSSCRKLRIGI